jgi:hypothetical protein
MLCKNERLFYKFDNERLDKVLTDRPQIVFRLENGVYLFFKNCFSLANSLTSFEINYLLSSLSRSISSLLVTHELMSLRGSRYAYPSSSTFYVLLLIVKLFDQFVSIFTVTDKVYSFSGALDLPMHPFGLFHIFPG